MSLAFLNRLRRARGLTGWWGSWLGVWFSLAACQAGRPGLTPLVVTPTAAPTVTTGITAAQPTAQSGAATRPAMATEAQPAQTTAFINVHVIPMDEEKVWPAQTIMVQGDRITQIGPTDQLTPPPTAQIIDGTGRYLLPGLADMHVHIWTPADFPLYLANGVTVVRNMKGSPQHLRWRADIRAGRLLGPDLFTSSPILDGDPPTAPDLTAIGDPAEGEALVRRYQAEGYDFIKVYSLLGPEVYRAMLAEARRLGLPVVGHLPVEVRVTQALEMGQSSLEHLFGYVDALEAADSPLQGAWSFRRLYGGIPIDLGRLPALAEATRAAQVWNCPTLTALDNWIPAEERARLLDQPAMQYVPAVTRSRLGVYGLDSYLADATPELLELGRRNRRAIVYGLYTAGAGLLLGTDAGSTYVIPGFDIHTELSNLVEAGLTPYAALRTGTWNAAAYVGQLDEFGSIAVGKRADLILVGGNPLTDLSVLRAPVGVMVRGQWLSAETLHTLLTP